MIHREDGIERGRVVALTGCPGYDLEGNSIYVSGLYELVEYERSDPGTGILGARWAAVSAAVPVEDQEWESSSVFLDPKTIWSQVDPRGYGEQLALERCAEIEMVYRADVLAARAVRVVRRTGGSRRNVSRPSCLSAGSRSCGTLRAGDFLGPGYRVSGLDINLSGDVSAAELRSVCRSILLMSDRSVGIALGERRSLRPWRRYGPDDVLVGDLAAVVRYLASSGVLYPSEIGSWLQARNADLGEARPYVLLGKRRYAAVAEAAGMLVQRMEGRSA